MKKKRINWKKFAKLYREVGKEYRIVKEKSDILVQVNINNTFLDVISNELRLDKSHNDTLDYRYYNSIEIAENAIFNM